MAYAVTFKASATKELGNLSKSISNSVLSKINALAANPRPNGCAKLKGAGNMWRIRVGDYRVVYVIDDTREIVDIRIIAHRGDVYRRL